MSSSQKRAVALLALAVVVFLVVVATQGRSGEGDVTAGPDGLPGLLGDRFGDSAAAGRADLSPSCPLEPGDRLVFTDSCTLRVAPADVRLRTVRLRAVNRVRVSSRAPESDFTISSDVDPPADPADPGADLVVAVDRDGADIQLSCPGFQQTCAVRLILPAG
jgi:hypothetical protein